MVIWAFLCALLINNNSMILLLGEGIINIQQSPTSTKRAAFDAAQYNKQAIQCTITFGDEYMTILDVIVVDYCYCSVVVCQIL